MTAATQIISVGDHRWVVRPDTSDSKAIAEVVTRRGYQRYWREGWRLWPGEWVDLGANIGAFAVVVASQPGVRRVHAYEPDPDSYALLVRNVQLNRVAPIVATHQAAVSADLLPGTHTLHRNDARGNHWRNSLVRPWRGGSTVDVEVVTPDAIPDGAHVKIDIEGSEMALLESLDFDRLGNLVFEWSFDVDDSLDRYRNTLRRLAASYPHIRPATAPAGDRWQPSWFPPCKTVFAWR